MNFGEFRFWLLLFIGMAGILILRCLFQMGPLKKFFSEGEKIYQYDRCAILFLGLFLLGCVNVLTLVIFLVVTTSTYLGLKVFLRSQTKLGWVVLSVLIPIQILPLLYYKYSEFLLNGIFRLQIEGLAGLLIPVGLSFYTFQVVGFVVDTVLHRERLPTYLDFMNFAGFFPQIVAGPIERREDLQPQMEQFRFRWDKEAIENGVPWLVLGLFFKICLADNLAVHFNRQSADNPFLIWLMNILFGLRIYYDFAGYSFVAYGIARCLGIKLTINFQSPYIARNAQDFWRRWHITLSTWFRDYVYLPLGGNRTALWSLNILLVFVISGIWHGSGWNFILWGAIWGGALIVVRLLKKFCLPSLIAWGVTLVVAFYSWLCFYETKTEVLFQKLATISKPWLYTPGNLQAAIRSIEPTDRFILLCQISLCAVVLLMEFLSVRRQGEPYSLLKKPWVLAVLVILTIFLVPNQKNDFIYFAF